MKQTEETKAIDEKKMWKKPRVNRLDAGETEGKSSHSPVEPNATYGPS